MSSCLSCLEISITVQELMTMKNKSNSRQHNINSCQQLQDKHPTQLNYILNEQVIWLIHLTIKQFTSALGNMTSYMLPLI
jgi:hypothetical protein